MHKTISKMGWLAGLSLVLAAGAACAQQKVSDESWRARWIQAPWSTERDGAELDGSRPMPVFRREFTLLGRPVKAELRIAGLGQYVVFVNAAEAEPKGLHQAWKDYRKTVTYDSLDVTKMLQS